MEHNGSLDSLLSSDWWSVWPSWKVCPDLWLQSCGEQQYWLEVQTQCRWGWLGPRPQWWPGPRLQWRLGPRLSGGKGDIVLGLCALDKGFIRMVEDAAKMAIEDTAKKAVKKAGGDRSQGGWGSWRHQRWPEKAKHYRCKENWNKILQQVLLPFPQACCCAASLAEESPQAPQGWSRLCPSLYLGRTYCSLNLTNK